MVNSSKRAGLGQTLCKAQKLANRRRNPRNSRFHSTEIPPTPASATRVDLRSVTAQTNLDEFFEEAQLAGKQFITERRNVALLDDNNKKINLYTKDERLDSKPRFKPEDIEVADTLSVPRRPKWNAETTPEALEEMERVSFLAWRRKLATIQEMDNVTLTPFEKNLEVWRQLWRVVERSDIVVQILDCRNPLLYLCGDLIKYVNEDFNGRKMNLILLNKADYLTLEQRRMWAVYFKKRGLKFIFFSALIENEKLKNSNKPDPESGSRQPGSSNDEQESEHEGEIESSGSCESGDVTQELQNRLSLYPNADEDLRKYDKFELLDTWRDLLKDLEKRRGPQSLETTESEKDPGAKFSEAKSECSLSHTRPLTVGLVGYPNVGKSSTINALLSAKRVAVSATPGKTKHFQTFFIDRDMMLCDCPGLVFPNFVSCKSEMVINGVLPIDQMHDYVGPVRLIVQRVPRGLFEDLYGLAFDHEVKQNITAEDLLNAFGFMRGYMTARGLPDISRASRKVCKDYINGKILYCEPPPGVDKKLYHSHSKLANAIRMIEERGEDPNQALKITERQRRLMVQAKGTQLSSREFDTNYFHGATGGAHIKGLPGIGNMTQPIGSLTCVLPPKREKKHKKREKLRIVYRDLDI